MKLLIPFVINKIMTLEELVDEVDQGIKAIFSFFAVSQKSFGNP